MKLSASDNGGKTFQTSVRKATPKLASEKESRLGDKQAFTKEQKFQDDARNALKDMRQTDTWKRSEKTLNDIPGLKNILNDAYKKGGNSLAMLGPKVARSIAEEVGTLTEGDVTRYVQNPSFYGGIKDTLSKLSSGKLSKESYNNLLRLLDISEKEAKRKRALAIDEGAKVFASRENIPLDEAKKYIDTSIFKDIKKPKVLTDEDKRALEWANKNPNDPRSNDIKQKLGM
jgi:hypothetical protein